ncbi:MAG: TIGR01458 family HAD-type hydrolase [Mariprofundaceae bacterium]
MSKKTQIQSVLLDLDGVLYIDGKPIQDAVKAVKQLREQGLTLAGITNTTTQPRHAIVKKLHNMGFALQEHEIFTPAAIAMDIIGQDSAALFIRDALMDDFQGIQISEMPKYIVMGDMGGEGYPPEMLKQIFQMMMNGSKLLALHKNRFWQKEDGLHLDLGVFVTAVEYASGQQATILGKPSTDFFHGICDQLGFKPSDTLMVGDDIESDIGGAQNVGLKTALVQTGKYRAGFVKQTGIKADLVIPSIADLPEAISLLK